MHIFRSSNFDSFLPKRLVRLEAPGPSDSVGENSRNKMENSDEVFKGIKAGEELARFMEAMAANAETEADEGIDTRDGADNENKTDDFSEAEWEETTDKPETKWEKRQAKQQERREMAKQVMHDEVLAKIEEQGDRNYKVYLKGDWVDGTVDNRKKVQVKMWEKQAEITEGRGSGVQNIDHFRHQERYATEKKEERRQRWRERQERKKFRKERKDAKKKGEELPEDKFDPIEARKQRQADEAELWALGTGWEFRKSFYRKKEEKNQVDEAESLAVQNPETEGRAVENTDYVNDYFKPEDFESLGLKEPESEILRNYILQNREEMGELTYAEQDHLINEARTYFYRKTGDVSTITEDLYNLDLVTILREFRATPEGERPVNVNIDGRGSTQDESIGSDASEVQEYGSFEGFGLTAEQQLLLVDYVRENEVGETGELDKYEQKIVLDAITPFGEINETLLNDSAVLTAVKTALKEYFDELLITEDEEENPYAGIKLTRAEKRVMDRYAQELDLNDEQKGDLARFLKADLFKKKEINKKELRNVETDILRFLGGNKYGQEVTKKKLILFGGTGERFSDGEKLFLQNYLARELEMSVRDINYGDQKKIMTYLQGSVPEGKTLNHETVLEEANLRRFIEEEMGQAEAPSSAEAVDYVVENAKEVKDSIKAYLDEMSPQEMERFYKITTVALNRPEDIDRNLRKDVEANFDDSDAIAGYQMFLAESGYPIEVTGVLNRATQQALVNHLGENYLEEAHEKKALAQRQKEAKNHEKKGEKLLNKGKYNEAIPVYEQLIAMNLSDPQHYEDYGYALENIGRYDEAVEAYKEARKLNPNAERHLSEGEALMKADRAKEAIEPFEKAIELKKLESGLEKIELAYPYSMLGQAFMAANQPQKAMEAFNSATQIDPEAAYENSDLMAEATQALARA